MATKVCPSCKAKFSCDADKDCWCESVQVHNKELMEIRGKFSDCICPECMKAFERE